MGLGLGVRVGVGVGVRVGGGGGVDLAHSAATERRGGLPRLRG